MGDPLVVYIFLLRPKWKGWTPRKQLSCSNSWWSIEPHGFPVLITGEHQELSQIIRGLWHPSWKHWASSHSSGWEQSSPRLSLKPFPHPSSASGLCESEVLLGKQPWLFFLTQCCASGCSQAQKLKLFIPRWFHSLGRPQLRFLKAERWLLEWQPRSGFQSSHSR